MTGESIVSPRKPPSKVEMPEHKLGVQWKQMAVARELANSTQRTLHEALRKYDSEDTSIVVSGSLARGEIFIWRRYRLVFCQPDVESRTEVRWLHFHLRYWRQLRGGGFCPPGLGQQDVTIQRETLPRVAMVDAKTTIEWKLTWRKVRTTLKYKIARSGY